MREGRGVVAAKLDGYRVGRMTEVSVARAKPDVGTKKLNQRDH